MYALAASFIYLFIHASSSLSHGRSLTSSIANSSKNALQCFLSQFPVSSRFLKVIQQLLMSASASSGPVYCSRSLFVQLFLRIAGVSYGRFMAMRCKLICQRVLRTVGDRQEGRDLNEKTLAADNGRQQSSANSVAYGSGVGGSTEK